MKKKKYSLVWILREVNGKIQRGIENNLGPRSKSWEVKVKLSLCLTN
jgi:hypothetical protein